VKRQSTSAETRKIKRVFADGFIIDIPYSLYFLFAVPSLMPASTANESLIGYLEEGIQAFTITMNIRLVGGRECVTGVIFEVGPHLYRLVHFTYKSDSVQSTVSSTKNNSIKAGISRENMAK
jgi:hypothetical protein